MATYPEKRQQILLAHAGLIQQVVVAAQNRDLQAQLEPALKASEENGWTALVAAIRKILRGQREATLLHGLDEEDQTIVEAILLGLRDPNTLRALQVPTDGSAAAPGLAGIIHAAATGDTDALQWLGQMAQQMSAAGGDMARIGGQLRRLMDGERDAEKLCKGMGAQGEGLMLSILEELGKLGAH
ncbi:MAG: hypothetical protein KDH88_13380 [Chromatiales bacterium]|nr:hypothetical protein [Chromatiales bacterium]